MYCPHSLLATMHQLQRRRGLYFIQMSQNGVCIRSVFEQKIGPYKVCIFVNTGPCGKVAALNHPKDPFTYPSTNHISATKTLPATKTTSKTYHYHTNLTVCNVLVVLGRPVWPSQPSQHQVLRVLWWDQVPQEIWAVKAQNPPYLLLAVQLCGFVLPIFFMRGGGGEMYPSNE